MIEINLVPDVKQELIRAQRIRAGVISLAVIITIAAAGLVVALSLYVFGVQAGRSYFSDQSIASESKKLASVQDISSVLTIQNQLSKLSALHDSKQISSRIFEILTAVTPSGDNKVTTTNLTIDTSTKTIKIEGQAVNQFVALETFKKTIIATKFSFTKDNQSQTVPLTTKVLQGEQSFGEDNSGGKVLRFTISFAYPDELFARDSTNAKVIAPGLANVSDSFVGVPASLFAPRASDLEEGDK